MLPEASGNGDEESECTALIAHAFSSETLSRWTQRQGPSLTLPTPCFSSAHVKCAYSSSRRDPRVAECLLKAGSNRSPKYQRLSFLFLTTLDQKTRQLSERLPPPMNLQFSFDSEEPVGTVRLSTLQDVVLTEWTPTRSGRVFGTKLQQKTSSTDRSLGANETVAQDRVRAHPMICLIHTQLI